MSDFTIIETQEQFDQAIKARLDREKSKYADTLAELDASKEKLSDLEKQISDLNSALTSANEKVASFDSQLAEKDSIIANYETASVKTRVANEMGLSFEAIPFLSGDNEEGIRKSAEQLKSLMGTKTVPLASTEPPIPNENSAYKELLNNLSFD